MMNIFKQWSIFVISVVNKISANQYTKIDAS